MLSFITIGGKRYRVFTAYSVTMLKGDSAKPTNVFAHGYVAADGAKNAQNKITRYIYPSQYLFKSH